MTPLMSAVRSGNKELVELLLEQGVIVSSANSYNGTALSIAKVKRLPEIVSLLEPYFDAEEETSPYKIAFHIAYKAVVKGIRYVNYKVRKLTGLYPGEWTDEL
jgi:ankyrin repeat protein